jgi:hypothetical protein
MRTLLNECLPPLAAGEQMVSPSGSPMLARTFPQNAVLGNLDNLVEVGQGGTVMATPGTGAEQAKPALERGLMIPETRAETEPVLPAPADKSAPTI